MAQILGPLTQTNINSDNYDSQWEAIDDGLSYMMSNDIAEWPEFADGILKTHNAGFMIDYIKHINRPWPEAEQDIEFDGTYWDEYQDFVNGDIDVYEIQ